MGKEGRIDKYGFVENQDFVIVSDFTETIKNGRTWRSEVKEYYGTLDMAKELAMVENNGQGRKARRYYIWVEQQLQSANNVGAFDRQTNDIARQLSHKVTGIDGAVTAISAAIAVGLAENCACPVSRLFCRFLPPIFPAHFRGSGLAG